MMFQDRTDPSTLVRVAIAYPSKPTSNPNSAHCPSSRNFGSAGHDPMGVLKVFSTTFTKPASSMPFLITSKILNVRPVISPASEKSCTSSYCLADGTRSSSMGSSNEVAGNNGPSQHVPLKIGALHYLVPRCRHPTLYLLIFRHAQYILPVSDDCKMSEILLFQHLVKGNHSLVCFLE